MISMKLESVAKVVKRLLPEQNTQNYRLMKAVSRELVDAIAQVRQLENTLMGETAK